MWFHAKARKLTTWVEEWRLLQQKNKIRRTRGVRKENKIRRTWGVRTASHTSPTKGFKLARFPKFQSLLDISSLNFLIFQLGSFTFPFA